MMGGPFKPVFGLSGFLQRSLRLAAPVAKNPATGAAAFPDHFQNPHGSPGLQWSHLERGVSIKGVAHVNVVAAVISGLGGDRCDDRLPSLLEREFAPVLRALHPPG